ncbi:hypothetical protein FD754_001080 [Muntiacus muntjak]|uniref:Uncharacterized protein n=1 Tax=Muntiacus muntjak TaxID=9888 RepID=A0A5N3W603_MUNMU|nr:hypothetical protein FD754_001080 [Muntiacus muntjak]
MHELGVYSCSFYIWSFINSTCWERGQMVERPSREAGGEHSGKTKKGYNSTRNKNLKRVAETWMDEFAEYIYQRRPEYRHLSPGDLSAQKELRRQLKCKDFKWFMAAVAWDVPKYYPPVEPPPAAWGERSSENRGGLRAARGVKGRGGASWGESRLPGETPSGSYLCAALFLPREFHGQRSLVGYSPWGHKDLFEFFHNMKTQCLQCSLIEMK